ncbi:hypothetical protein Hanom_Chr10g00925191 [Helianthus anomalus]
MVTLPFFTVSIPFGVIFMLDVFQYFTTVKPVRQLFENETLVSIVILVIEDGNCPFNLFFKPRLPNVGGS